MANHPMVRRADIDAINADLLQEWTAELSAVESTSVRRARRPKRPATPANGPGDVLGELQALRQLVEGLTKRVENLEAQQAAPGTNGHAARPKKSSARRPAPQPASLSATNRLRRQP
jgi:hypothetical protein